MDQFFKQDAGKDEPRDGGGNFERGCDRPAAGAVFLVVVGLAVKVAVPYAWVVEEDARMSRRKAGRLR